MMQEYFYLLILSSMCLDFVMSQYSDAGFSYIGMPGQPVIPASKRPDAHIRPMTAKPGRRRPSVGGSRYLRDEGPRKKDLNKTHLMELMGDHYEASWMSAEKPRKRFIPVPSHVVDSDRIPGGPPQQLFKQARDLNLTAEFSNFEPELLPLQDQIRSWLLKRSTCPVEFTWKDLGRKFWPRWVRQGECVDRNGTCSFPTGNNCVPGETTKVQILHWKCKDRKKTIVKRGASGSDSADKAIPKRRGLGRRRPKDESKHRRRVAERLGTSAETADEATNRRRVVDENPKQKRRKRKLCYWERQPFDITIECFCTC